MSTETDLPSGSHLKFVRAVGDVEVSAPDGRTIELVASFLPEPNLPVPLIQQATSVAIHMDQLVATGLALKLRETFQTMGWPLPEEGECQV